MSKELFGQAIVTSIASPATKYFAFAAPLQNGAENILVSKFIEQTLTGMIGGSGVANQIPYFSGTGTIAGDTALVWDAVNDIITFPKWKPLSDSPTALTFYKTDGITKIGLIDSTNQIFKLHQIGADATSTGTQRNSGKFQLETSNWNGSNELKGVWDIQLIQTSGVNASEYFAVTKSGLASAFSVSSGGGFVTNTSDGSTPGSTSFVRTGVLQGRPSSTTNGTALTLRNTNSTDNNYTWIDNEKSTGAKTLSRIGFHNVAMSIVAAKSDFVIQGCPSGQVSLAELYRITAEGLHGLMIASPTVRQQISSGVAATAVYTKYSIPTTTGETASDGTNFGLDLDGNAIWNQLESTKTLKIQTNSVDRIVIDANGYIKIAQGLSDYASDALASAGGVPLNGLYRNGNSVQICLI